MTSKKTPILLLLPLIVTIFSIIIYPAISAIFSSFTNQELLSENYRIIGLENYFRLIGSDVFISSFTNGVIFAIGITFISLVFGMGIALLLNEPIKGRSIASGLLLFPYLIPTVAAAFMFKWIFHDVYGIMNYGLVSLGLIDGPRAWLGSPDIAMFSSIIVGVWRFFPFVVISILARLQNIPQYLYEAAKVEGANIWQRFKYVTLPQLSNVLVIVILFRFIWMFNNFDLIWLLTRGGPAFATQHLPILTYLQIFWRYQLGLGSATATIMFLTLILLSIIYLKIYKFKG